MRAVIVGLGLFVLGVFVGDVGRSVQDAAPLVIEVTQAGDRGATPGCEDDAVAAEDSTGQDDATLGAGVDPDELEDENDDDDGLLPLIEMLRLQVA